MNKTIHIDAEQYVQGVLFAKIPRVGNSELVQVIAL